MSSSAALVFDAAVAVTKSDSSPDPAGPFAALYIGAAGNIKFIDSAGNVTGPTAVAAGEFRVRTVQVWSTGTTATGILGLKAVP